MALWPKLQCLISESELDSLPETAKTKIEGNLVELDQLVQSLKSENAELSAVSERQQFQYEKELFDYQNQLKESTEACMTLRSQITELEKDLSSVSEKWRELQKTHDTVVFDLQSAKRTNTLVAEEKRQLFEQVEKRRAEVDKLNEDMKCLLAQATTSNEEKHAAIAQEEATKLSVSSQQHVVNRLEREKSLLERQVNDMHTELSQKNHEVMVLRKEKSTVVLELQSELENRVDEAHLLQDQLKSLKEKSEEKDQRIDALAKKIRSLNETSQEMEEQYQLEINAQTKLVELYKKASEDNQKRVMELVSAFEEAQKLLQEAAESRNEAEARMEAFQSQYKSHTEKLEHEINRLKSEHSNNISQGKGFSAENLESFFPTAAATSKVIRSGMSFTDMYSEYVKAQEEIQILKSENLRLNEQMKQIVSEIEENTPVINQRMADYHKALDTITCLRTQITNTLTDQDILQSEKSDLKRKCGQIERENGRFKKQVSDLNRQVQILLKEVVEVKGGSVKHEAAVGDEEVSSSDEITAERIISKHLVTFRDIVDLQTKNQQLLAVVRDLSEKQEQQEKKLTEEKTAELQKELKNVMCQFEDLQKNRIKQTELIESIIRQRDMYRVLLTNQGFSDALLGSPHGVSTLSPKIRQSPGDSVTKSAMNQLQSEFDNYKKEKTENQKMLTEKLEKTKNELSDLRIECAKLSSQLEYSEERLKLLQTNMENYKKEAMFLRDKNQKHTVLITQHQQKIHSLQEEVMESQQKIAKSTVSLDNLRAERDLLKGVELRLIHENESLLHEQQHKTQVLANLQSFKNNLERFESETKRNLKLQVEKYEKDTALLKMQVESAKEEYQTAVKVWEKQEKEMQQKVESEIEKNRKLHEDLVDAYSKFHAVSQELSSVKQNVGVSKTPGVTPSISTPSASETKSLKEHLMEAQAKIKGLQEQVDLTRKSSERYISMSNDLELRVKEQDEINKNLKENMDSSMESNIEIRKSLERRLEDIEKTNRNLIEENMKLTQDKELKLQELQIQVTELQKEIISHQTISETAAKTATQAREDCLQQKKMMQETQEKYERELIAHADDVQSLSTLKEEHKKCSMNIEEMQNAVNQAQETLQQKEVSWLEREKCIRREEEALKQRIGDIEKQNGSLLHQVELMTTQLAAVRSEEWDKLRAENSGEDLRDTQHLLQIIQFLKKEKEILSTTFDATQSENVRLKLKGTQLSSELEALKTEVLRIHNSQEVRASSDAQHAELLRKIETLNLLTESNTLLRLEKENLVKAQQELEEKVNKLDLQMQPLSEQNKDLNSRIEMLGGENAALKQEVQSWQSRTNQLLEQSHRIGPQEYQNLTRQMEELKAQKQKLTEELQRKQTESSQMNSSFMTVKKELEMVKDILKARTQEVEKKVQENIDFQKTMVQVKKIGRKYKTQYDELKVTHDDLVAKNQVSDPAAQNQLMQETQKRLQDSEKALKDLKDEYEKQKEKAKQDLETLEKDASTKEEKFKSLLAQLRQRYSAVNNIRDKLVRENAALSKDGGDMKKRIEEMEKQMNIVKQGSSDEETIRTTALKSQYESKIVRLERELKSTQETVEYLVKQYDDLCQKQKPSSKAASVSGIVERGSGSSEPLTANIKPLSPAQSQATSLRTTAANLVAASQAKVLLLPSPRSTPTASIRPMAIGSVTSSSPQTRMAAVLPTTVSISSMQSSVEEDLTVVIVSSASSCLQATVLPTPATATVAPTTVTVTPSVHTPVISEVTTTSAAPSSIDSPSEQQTSAADSSQGIHVATVSHMAAHATALVGPRVDTIGSLEATVVETPAPTASVIVSPPTTQTQMVPPTVKRTRDESPGSADSPDSNAQKRVRMVSEGSQTNQRQSVASTSSNIAIVSAATIVTRNKAEIPTSEVTPNVHVETTQSVPTLMPSTTSSAAFTVGEVTFTPIYSGTPLSSATPLSSTTFTVGDVTFEPILSTISPSITDSDTKTSTVEERDEQTIDWDGQDDTKPSEEFTVEIMEEEDEESGEHMEEFDDERGTQDEDMADDQEAEVVEMGEQHADDSIDVIEALDTSSDHQMEADSSQVPTDEQCMAPPLFPMPQVHESPTSAVDAILGPSTTTQGRRTPIAQRVQHRLTSAPRQHLQPFTMPVQVSQGPSFEEGDDSIVPSTPTLFVPRRTDGFAEAVSSPHVPSGRFLFSSAESSPTQQGLSQLASQGALGVDDTRMDLSQFDDGSGRTVPSTPLQVSPLAESSVSEVPEIVTELAVGDQSNDAAVPVPTIKIETPEEQNLKEEASALEEIAAFVGGDSLTQEVVPKVAFEKDENFSRPSLVPTSTALGESEVPKKETGSGDGDSQSQGPPPQTTRKPIVWEEEASPSGGTTVTVVPSASTPIPPGPAFSPPTSVTAPNTRAQRTRRMRYRGGAASTTHQRGSTTYTTSTGRRGRGCARRSRMF